MLYILKRLLQRRRPVVLSPGGFERLGELILAAPSDSEQLTRCEAALPSLPSYISSCRLRLGAVPASVPCRDLLPDLYLRRGLWGKAEAVVRFCAACSAYEDASVADGLLCDIQRLRGDVQ